MTSKLTVTEHDGNVRQPTPEDFRAYTEWLQSREVHEQFYASELPEFDEFYAHQRPYPPATVITEARLTKREKWTTWAWSIGVLIMLALAILGVAWVVERLV